MSSCRVCNSDLVNHHILESRDIDGMKNCSRIIDPMCEICGKHLTVEDVQNNITSKQKVVLISGTCGSGKSAIGQYIENNYDYIFIDGDAVSKKLNYYAKKNPEIKRNEYLCHTETIQTMLITLGLGYNVVIGYVFETDDLVKYKKSLALYGISPVIRVLLPDRSTCIKRDKERECWTAGAEFVDKWYLSQKAYQHVMPENCIDSSYETLKETVELHFHGIL